MFILVIDEWFGLKNLIVYFAAVITMKGKRRTYNVFQRVSAIFMILALLWLTISAPFVVASQLGKASYEKITDIGSDSEEETANPFGNNTEEKSPNSASFSEEYLHDHHKTDHFFLIISRSHNCEDAGTYIAFHGELLVPPPDLA